MRKKLTRKSFSDSLSKHQFMLAISESTMEKLLDIHRCHGIEQEIGVLAGDIFEFSVAKHHADLPIFSD